MSAPLLSPSHLHSLAHARRIQILGTVGFVAALATASQIAIPLPDTPVPITLQPFVVVLAGLMLGPGFGAASMILYLAIGAAGVPVFAPMGAPGLARLVGPTGGYLIAYPVAAYAAGFVSQRFPSLLGRWCAAIVGVGMLFVGGIAQLTILTGNFSRAIAVGVTPFVALDVVKAFVAALVARPRARSATD